MKRIILLSVTLFFLFAPVKGQTSIDYEKANKELMKAVKKQNGLKKVEVKIENDGFWYFLLISKSMHIGIADKDGKIIIQPTNTEIKYYPKMEEGYSNITLTDQKGVNGEFMLYHKNSNSIFLTQGQTQDLQNIINVYDVKGNNLLGDIRKSITYIPGYFIIGANKLSFYQSKSFGVDVKFIYVIDSYPNSNLGLYTIDGIELLKPEYSDIKIDKDNSCVFKKDIDNTHREGGFTLYNSSEKVPCIFYSVCYYDKDKVWKIQRNSNSKLEVYKPMVNYTINYRDLGEQYYEKGEYDNVITFYANEGISAPWAKFFTAKALQTKASFNIISANECSKLIEENNKLYNILKDDKNVNEVWRFDLNLAQQQLITAKNLLEAYLLEDSIYSEQAKQEISFINSRLNDLVQAQKRYDQALALLKQRNEEARLAEIRRQQAALQRQNEVMAAILNGFLNALSSNTNRGSGSRSVSRGYSSSSSRTSSSSSNNGSNASKIAEWQSRKENGEKMIAKYRDDLRKDPNSATLKQEIRQQEDYIRMCNENIARLKSGN